MQKSSQEWKNVSKQAGTALLPQTVMRRLTLKTGVLPGLSAKSS